MRCPDCGVNPTLLVGDGKNLSIHDRHTEPGCSSLEQIYPLWRYLATVFITWEDSGKSIESYAARLGTEEGDHVFEGEIGVDILFSSTLVQRLPSGTHVSTIIVPERCVLVPTFSNLMRDVSYFSVPNDVFDQLHMAPARYVRMDFSQSNFRVSFLWSTNVRRESFDCFFLPCDQFSRGSSLNDKFAGHKILRYNANKSLLVADDMEMGTEFNISLGQLPLHLAQPQVDVSGPTFVVGPKAWDAISDHASSVLTNPAASSFILRIGGYGKLSISFCFLCWFKSFRSPI
jgi:hypothetical protein